MNHCYIYRKINHSFIKPFKYNRFSSKSHIMNSFCVILKKWHTINVFGHCAGFYYPRPFNKKKIKYDTKIDVRSVKYLQSSHNVSSVTTFILCTINHRSEVSCVCHIWRELSREKTHGSTARFLLKGTPWRDFLLWRVRVTEYWFHIS